MIGICNNKKCEFSSVLNFFLLKWNRINGRILSFIREHNNQKWEANLSYLSSEKYFNIINVLKGGSKFWRLNTFEIINIGGEAFVEKGDTNI